jgi:hypothetical protein
MSNISVRAGGVSAPAVALLGLVATLALTNYKTTFLVVGGAAEKVVTIVVDTAANSTEYAFTFEGETISYTSDGSATKPEISAGLAAAFNANPIARGVASVADDGVDTLTFTGLVAGYDYSVSESDGNLTLATVTAAASASDIGAGLGVIRTGTSEGVEKGGVAKSASLTAQVDSYVITYDASVDIIVTVEVDGAQYIAEHTMATDLATSGAAIVAQLNAVLPANTVLAAFNTATLTLTSEVAGKTFVSGVGFGTGRDTGAAVKTTNSTSGATDIVRALAGVTCFTYDEASRTIGSSTFSYEGGLPAQVLKAGEVWVSSTESVAITDPVYIELGNSNSGQFYKTSSSTRVKLPASVAQWVRKDANSDLALLRITL